LLKGFEQSGRASLKMSDLDEIVTLHPHDPSWLDEGSKRASDIANSLHDLDAKVEHVQVRYAGLSKSILMSCSTRLP
jgi:hypothetical protein